MRRSRYLIGALFILLILGGAGYYFYWREANAAAAAEVEDNTLRTAVARQGNIVVSALGAGAIIPADQVSVGFSSGTFVEIAVRIGEYVAAGDVLARSDATAAQETLLNAQLQLAQQNIQIDGSQTQTGTSLSDISVAQAELNLGQVQAALTELLTWQPDESAIAQAEAALAASQAAYDAAVASHTAGGKQVTVANISVNQAVRALADAQAAFDVAHDPARDWELNDPRLASRLESERESTTQLAVWPTGRSQRARHIPYASPINENIEVLSPTPDSMQ